MKKKIYVLLVSKQFPKTHNKSGASTGFVENISKLSIGESQKIHTIRSNYELWAKRVSEINSGHAILSIRYWSGMPYRSTQVEICQLDNVGVQKLEEPDNFLFANIGGNQFNWEELAKNDGLSFEDFCEWFKCRQKEPMAIIHFTDFRYK